MFRQPIFVLIFFALPATAAGAQSQSSPPAASAAPKPAESAKPFRSAFEGYKRFDAELPLTDWRTVNDNVHQRGGWREYAKEAAKAHAHSPAQSQGKGDGK
ncbi:MAG: hypothetical protein JNN20_07155 [Betaproteobacteria bacterium]|nr:hypothetical protein [Betaproteobacteria bacterium]